jgi:hypothetical protein
MVRALGLTVLNRRLCYQINASAVPFCTHAARAKPLQRLRVLPMLLPLHPVVAADAAEPERNTCSVASQHYANSVLLHLLCTDQAYLSSNLVHTGSTSLTQRHAPTHPLHACGSWSLLSISKQFPCLVMQKHRLAEPHTARVASGERSRRTYTAVDNPPTTPDYGHQVDLYLARLAEEDPDPPSQVPARLPPSVHVRRAGHGLPRTRALEQQMLQLIAALT